MNPIDLIKNFASETASPSYLSVLDTHFGCGERFLQLWSEWRSRPESLQSTRLVYVATLDRTKQSWLSSEKQPQPAQLKPLADLIQTRLTGLMSGLNRFTFDQASVHLHLFIGHTSLALKLLEGRFDWVYLEDENNDHLIQTWNHAQTGALAKLCKPGAQLSSSCTDAQLIKSLTIHGFVCRIDQMKCPRPIDLLHAVYRRPPRLSDTSRALLVSPLCLQSNDPLDKAKGESVRGNCAVIGAGLAGASAAYAMAKRGWNVQVFDTQAQTSMGASAVPLGVFSTQLSADDNPQSRLMRAGVRLTNQVLEELLSDQEGLVWKKSGVLEVRSPAHENFEQRGQEDAPCIKADDTTAHLNAKSRKKRKSDPRDFPVLHCEQSPHWYTITHQYDSALRQDHKNTAEQGLIPCVMHNQGGWLKPRFLVEALLKHPRIELCLSQTVKHIIPTKHFNEDTSITQVQCDVSDSNEINNVHYCYKLQLAEQDNADLNNCQSNRTFDHVIVANAIGASTLLEPLLCEHGLRAVSSVHQLSPTRPNTQSSSTPEPGLLQCVPRSLAPLLHGTYGVMNWGWVNRQVAQNFLPFAINGSGSFVTCPSNLDSTLPKLRQENKAQTNHSESEWYAGASFERLSASASSYSVPYQEACKKTSQEPQTHLQRSVASDNVQIVSDPARPHESTGVRLCPPEQGAQVAPAELLNKTVQLSQENLLKLKALYPVAHKWVCQLPKVQSWSGVRASTTNHLPWVQNFAPDLCTPSSTNSRAGLANALSGVSVLAGLGSKGIALAPLCAEILACEIHREPSPVEKDLLKNLKKII